MKKLLFLLFPILILPNPEEALTISSADNLSKLHLAIHNRVNASDINSQTWNESKRGYTKRLRDQKRAQGDKSGATRDIAIKISDNDANSFVNFDTTYQVVNFSNSKIVGLSNVNAFYAKTNEAHGTHIYISPTHDQSLVSFVFNPVTYQVSDFKEVNLDTIGSDEQTDVIVNKIMKTLLDDKKMLLRMQSYKRELDTSADDPTILKLLEGGYLKFLHIRIKNQREDMIITKCYPHDNRYNSLIAISDFKNDKFTTLMWTRVLQVMEVADETYLFCVNGSPYSGGIVYETYRIIDGKLIIWKIDGSFAA